MQLSETVKLYPTEYQAELIKNTMSEYISTVNNIVSDYSNDHSKGVKEIKNIKEFKSISKLTTAAVKVNLPSALCNQSIRDAKSIVKKYNKACKKVKEVNDGNLLVTYISTAEGFLELSEGDYVISKDNLQGEGQEGDTVEIWTNGIILETYPAQIGLAYRIEKVG